MKTWRERIAEAENRHRSWGRWMWAKLTVDLGWPFTYDDCRIAGPLTTCAASEIIARYGLYTLRACSLYTIGSRLHRAVLYGDVVNAERLLTEIEDRALQLKREQA